jgi:hypothetical protein
MGWSGCTMAFCREEVPLERVLMCLCYLQFWIVNSKKRRATVHQVHASDARSAVGHPARKANGSAPAATNGTRSIQEGFAQPACTSGLKPSAFAVAVRRRIRTGMRNRDNDRLRSFTDRRILADLRCQCFLPSPNQRLAFSRVSVSSALRLQRTLGCAAVDDHQNWEATAPQSSSPRSSSAAPRHWLCHSGRRSGRRACRWRCRKILAS